jgi:hypothetical protein
MEAEKIIISKKYFELTSAELEVVSELVSNEADYDAMKLFLISTNNVFSNEKIMETKALDSNIMTHLHASPSTRVPWYNAFLLFLFPRGRSIYQYPAFQLGIATVLIFIMFNIINFNSLEDDNSIAFEDVSKKEQIKNLQEQFLLEEKSTELEEKVIPVAILDSLNFINKEEKFKNMEVIEEEVGNISNHKNEIYKSSLNDLEPMDFDMDDSEESEIVNNEQPIKSIVADKKLVFSDNVVLSKDVADGANNSSSGTVNVNVIEEDKRQKLMSESVAIEKDRSDNNQVLRKKEKVESKKSYSSNKLNDYKLDISDSLDGGHVTPNKISISNTPELKQLFFEVK